MTNITLRRVCAALAVLLTVSVLFNCTLSRENIKLTEDRNSWEDDGRLAIQACLQVANYCDSTADTGQMDDFIQSDNGQKFWHNWMQVVENNE